MSLCLAPLIGACSLSQNPTHAELCRETVLDYASFRDDPDTSQEYGLLFTQDGSFTLGPNTITGRKALIARHKTANERVVFNHVMDDILVRADLTGKSRVIVYTSARNGNHDITRVIVADYMDRYEIKGGKCLIADRNVAVLFDTNSARIIPTGQ